MTEETSLAVLTPSFQYADFLVDAVESVRKQPGPPTIHIIQDGGSTDGSVEVANRARESGYPVEIVSEPDMGQSDALNRALARVSSSEWIGWLNADEFYLPTAFRDLETWSRAHPSVDVFFGDCVFVDARGRTIRLLPGHRYRDIVLRQYGCFISSCTVFVKRDLLADIGWSTRFRRAMDWNLWLTLRRRQAKFQYIPRPIAAFRVHGAQITNVPESVDSDEFELLRRSHGIRPTLLAQAMGHVVHVGTKACEGSYHRQWKTQQFRGASLRWWTGLQASRNIQGLLSAYE